MLYKSITVPIIKHIENIYRSLTPTERWIFYVLSILLALSTLSLMYQIYSNATVPVPQSGGSIVEGVIGAPRFVNPVLAISQTDKDLSELIYAGLMTRDADGNIIPELAKSYTISDDSLTYTFTLNENLTFHDGTPLSADDVLFTIEKILEPGIKSPERANWEGVTVEKVDDLTITFTLKKPYAQFLQNTLIGILPKEHWEGLSADEFIFSKLNTEPIGSGPYQFISATHSTSGIPRSFQLKRYADYVRGTPYIKNITMNFYPDANALEKALKSEEVTSISEVASQNIKNITDTGKYTTLTATLPRIFAVFLNINNNEALEYKAVRTILRDTINKKAIIQDILNGYGQSIDSILIQTDETQNEHPVLSAKDAQKALENAGWEKNDDDGLYYNDGVALELTLTTVNNPELKAIATYIADTWSSIGINVKIEVFEPGSLTQSVLRSRNYDALLFGEIIGTEPDPYAFWHSSQRNDPGLNIANYANTKVDSLLIKARKTIDNDERAEIYETVAQEINKDIPAIFIYAPYYIYITRTNIYGIKIPRTMEPHERFANVHLWHVKKKRLLNFLDD